MTEKTPQQGDNETIPRLQQEQSISLPVTQVTQEVRKQAGDAFTELFKR